MDYKCFHQHPCTFNFATHIFTVIAIIWINFGIKSFEPCMYIMGNGNDMLVRIPSWKCPDEKHDFNNVFPPMQPIDTVLASLKQASSVQPVGDTANNR